MGGPNVESHHVCFTLHFLHQILDVIKKKFGLGRQPSHYVPNSNLAISLGQKWNNCLKIEIAWATNETNAKVHHALKGPQLFWGRWGWGVVVKGERFFIFLGILMCSHHIPKKVPMCCQRVSFITPDFKPMCLRQNLPLLTYIGGLE